MSNLAVTLYNEEGDFEYIVEVEYRLQPKEPDVGIPCAFGEIENITLDIPVFGPIEISLDKHDTDIVEEAISDEIFEDDCLRGYRG